MHFQFIFFKEVSYWTARYSLWLSCKRSTSISGLAWQFLVCRRVYRNLVKYSAGRSYLLLFLPSPVISFAFIFWRCHLFRGGGSGRLYWRDQHFRCRSKSRIHACFVCGNNSAQKVLAFCGLTLRYFLGDPPAICLLHYKWIKVHLKASLPCTFLFPRWDSVNRSGWHVSLICNFFAPFAPVPFRNLQPIAVDDNHGCAVCCVWWPVAPCIVSYGYANPQRQRYSTVTVCYCPEHYPQKLQSKLTTFDRV